MLSKQTNEWLTAFSTRTSVSIATLIDLFFILPFLVSFLIWSSDIKEEKVSFK